MAKNPLPEITDAPNLAPAGDSTALHFNAAEYLKLLEDEDGTDEQKIACLEVLWEIMVAHVDFGFGIHPLQQALGNCALESDSGAVVDSDNSENTEKKTDEGA